jgi:hypothetical protein
LQNLEKYPEWLDKSIIILYIVFLMVEKSYGRKHRKGHEKGGGRWFSGGNGEGNENESRAAADERRRIGGHNSGRKIVFINGSKDLPSDFAAPEGEQLNKLVEYVQGFSKKSQFGKKGRH